MKVKEDSRLIGIDLLRVISMALITGIHFICYSNVRSSFDMIPNYNKCFIVFLDTFDENWITLFLLISGYFLISKPVSINRAISLWIKVVFISLIVALPCVVFNLQPISQDRVIHTLFPVLSKNYWYIDGYLLLLLFIPIINAYINATSKETLKKGLVIIGVIYSFLLINPYTTVEYYLGPGSSVFHFGYIYAIGCYLRLYPITTKTKIVLSLFVFISILLYLLKFYNFEFVGSLGLLRNISLLPLMWSISLFCLMSKIKVQLKSNVLTKISAASLTVYLVQEQDFFRYVFWRWIDADSYAYSYWYVFVWIVSIVILYFVSCILDYIYERLSPYFIKPIEHFIINKLKL